ncbi:hypothetical protein DEO72_LG6g569 [Vigna unguiculata]|uniref:Uncharacterized protein n=1 Tax=Vigna unguiculata TaxID=3917 RepID=A0A4D6M3P9_VIGUN|nr:hypothetical protein DEO72_LG6g569 [Vigna unguiculata]
MKAANRDDIEVEEYQVQLMLLDNIDKKKTPNQSRSWCCLTSLVPSQEHLKPFSHPASWKHAYK